MSNTRTHHPLLDGEAITVDELLEVLPALGRRAAYDAIRAGELPSFRVGRRLLIPTAPLRRMLGHVAGSTEVELERGA